MLNILIISKRGPAGKLFTKIFNHLANKRTTNTEQVKAEVKQESHKLISHHHQSLNQVLSKICISAHEMENDRNYNDQDTESDDTDDDELSWNYYPKNVIL